MGMSTKATVLVCVRVHVPFGTRSNIQKVCCGLLQFGAVSCGDAVPATVHSSAVFNGCQQRKKKENSKR